MKALSKIILALSIVANVALAIVLIRGASQSSTTDSGETTAPSADKTVAAPKPAPQVWGKLESEDLPDMVKRLRSAGFPPNLVRAILAAQLETQFAARRKTIEGDTSNSAYWKNTATDPKTQAALRALAREQQKALRDLLGADAESNDAMYQSYRDRGLAGLPPEKAAEVRQITRDYEEQRQDLYASLSVGGSISFTSLDGEKLQAIEKAMHNDLAKVLSPAELESYDLMTSNTAQSLRYMLSAFDATPDEFRTLFKLQSDFDQQFGTMYATPSQDEMKRRSDAQKVLNEQIKVALGTQRYEDYQRATDYNYRQTSQLVSRLELPPETATQLYAVQKDFQQRLNQLRETMMATPPADRGAAMQSMTQQVTALQQEAITKVTPILRTDSALEAYKQYGGAWITNMVPRPSAPGGGGTIIMR